tara:strand:- start:14 stop:316 length:303 start_codon:yes stop_codon:yes gene_type:complete
MEFFEFESMEEFDTLFDSKDRESVTKVTTAIFTGIQSAIQNKEDEAELFSLSFKNLDDGLEVCLPRDQWDIALNNCQKNFHDMEMFDTAIDVYNLRKELS